MANITVKNYPVTGMSCTNCAVSAERIIKAQEGVSKAGVNFASAVLSVQYNPELTTPAKLKSALQSGGYDLLIEEDSYGNLKEESDRRNFLTQKRKVIGAGVLTIPVVIIGMFFMNHPLAGYLSLIMATPVVFWYGRSFFINAFRQAKHFRANMDTLVALSTGIAYFYSLFVLLFDGIAHKSGLHGQMYFEAAAVVVTFILLGKLLEARAKSNTSSALKKLIGLQPKTVTIVNSSSEAFPSEEKEKDEDAGYSLIPIANVAVGRGAENGILIKDAESLELSHKINAVVLDKTGTITNGKPELTDIDWEDGKDTPKNINLLYQIERLSEHPLAESVLKYYKEDVTGHELVLRLENITGRGIKANDGTNNYFVGNLTLMEEQAVNVSGKLMGRYLYWSDQGKTVFFFANEDSALAVIAVADTMKKNSSLAVKTLLDKGIEVYMLTGDNEQTAKKIAQQAGILNYKAGVLPSDKYEFIKKLQKKGKVVAVVGDGINDTQALAQAEVSIAMGKGSDIAIDAAKMTIISSDLLKIPLAINLSGRTVKTIRQNLFWAFIYNIISIPVAAGALFPFIGFMLNPMIAGLAMTLSSVSVVSNSLRLRYSKL